MLTDCLAIILVAIGSALFSEGLSWLLIYRTATYKRLKAQAEKASKALEKRKDVLGGAEARKSERRVAKLEQELKLINQNLTMVKMKSMIVLSISMVSLLSAVNSAYEGIVVAKLPFEPIGFLQGISHRNLAGSDFTDCSSVFLYAMTAMGVRSNLQKLLGVEPPKLAGGSLFDPDAAGRQF